MSDEAKQHTQIDLVVEPPGAWVPSSNNETSAEAARLMGRSGAAGRLRWAVLRSMLTQDATDQELCDRLGASGDSIRPRRGELAHRGLIVATDRTRPTKSGASARVYEITDKGRALLRRPAG